MDKWVSRQEVNSVDAVSDILGDVYRIHRRLNEVNQGYMQI